MALKKADIEKIKGYGFDVDALITAIKADAETDYPVPDIVVFKPADFELRLQNERAAEATTVKKTERDALVKEIKTKLNITATGERVGDIVAAVQAQITADGGTKLTALQEQVNALTKDKETLTANLTEQQQVAKKAQFQAGLVAKMPANRTKIMTDEERIMALERVFQFEEVDGKVVVKRDGKIVADSNTHAPVALDKVIGDYFTERSWLDAPGAGGAGGRGGGDRAGGGAGGGKTLTDVKASWIAANPGKNPNSSEFMDHLNTIAAADKTFDYDS